VRWPICIPSDNHPIGVRTYEHIYAGEIEPINQAHHVEQGGGSYMFSVRRYVCVPQDIRFSFQIF
jgi:hypothetical protein